MDDKGKDDVGMDGKGKDDKGMDDEVMDDIRMDDVDEVMDDIRMDDVGMNSKGMEDIHMDGTDKKIDLSEYMEYLDIVNKTFRTENEAYRFYLEYARRKGFGVRKDDLKYRGLKENAYRRTYKCCKQGFRASKHFDRAVTIRTPRGLSRCGCPALFQVQLQEKGDGRWFVKNFVDDHNHPFVPPDLTPYLSSHRKLTDAQKADVIEYAVGGLRTHQIMNVMEKNAGGLDNLGFIDRDLYNHVSIQKRKRIEGNDARYLLTYMLAQKQADPEFFYQYTKDSEGHLRNIFWADSQSRIDYVAFGGVVVFDSTYRSNRYRLPFVPFVGLNHHRSTVLYGIGLVSDETVESYQWLLTVFLEAMS